MDDCDDDKRSLLLKKINPPAGRQAGQAAEVQAGNRLALSWAAAAGRQGKTSAAQPATPWSITNGQAHRDLVAVDNAVSRPAGSSGTCSAASAEEQQLAWTWASASSQ